MVSPLQTMKQNKPGTTAIVTGVMGAAALTTFFTLSKHGSMAENVIPIWDEVPGFDFAEYFNKLSSEEKLWLTAGIILFLVAIAATGYSIANQVTSKKPEHKKLEKGTIETNPFPTWDKLTAISIAPGEGNSLSYSHNNTQTSVKVFSEKDNPKSFASYIKSLKPNNHVLLTLHYLGNEDKNLNKSRQIGITKGQGETEFFATGAGRHHYNNPDNFMAQIQGGLVLQSDKPLNEQKKEVEEPSKTSVTTKDQVVLPKLLECENVIVGTSIVAIANQTKKSIIIAKYNKDPTSKDITGTKNIMDLLEPKNDFGFESLLLRNTRPLLITLESQNINTTFSIQEVQETRDLSYFKIDVKVRKEHKLFYYKNLETFKDALKNGKPLSSDTEPTEEKAILKSAAPDPNISSQKIFGKYQSIEITRGTSQNINDYYSPKDNPKIFSTDTKSKDGILEQELEKSSASQFVTIRFFASDTSSNRTIHMYKAEGGKITAHEIVNTERKKAVIYNNLANFEKQIREEKPLASDPELDVDKSRFSKTELNITTKE